MKPYTLLSFLILCLFALWSCGSGGDASTEKENSSTTSSDDGNSESSEEEQSGPFAAMEKAMKEVESALEVSGGKVEPIDFRTLKEMLPETAAGLPRKSSEGEKAGTMGIKISTANADYSSEEGDKSLEISITDMGYLSNTVALATAGWLMAEIDRETDNEYEKTTTFGGYKAFEKYNSQYNDGSLAVLVGERFIVQIDGNGVSMDEIKAAMEAIDLDNLEAMKDEGREE